jgi:hypothetical protein
MTRSDRALRRYMGSKVQQLIVHAAVLDRVGAVIAGATRTAHHAGAVTALTIPSGMRTSPR